MYHPRPSGVLYFRTGQHERGGYHKHVYSWLAAPLAVVGPPIPEEGHRARRYMRGGGGSTETIIAAV